MTTAASFFSVQPCSRGQVMLMDPDPLPFLSLRKHWGQSWPSVNCLGQRPFPSYQKPRRLPAAPCFVSAEDAFSKLSRAMHGSELRSAWPPPGLLGCSRADCIPKPLHGFPVCRSRHRLESCSEFMQHAPPHTHTHTHLFCLYVEVPPVQSLRVSLPLPSFKTTVVLTDHLNLSPRPHLAGCKGPFVCSADELWEVGLRWSLLALTQQAQARP